VFMVVGAVLGALVPSIVSGARALLPRLFGGVAGSVATPGIVRSVGGAVVRGAGRVLRNPIGGAIAGTAIYEAGTSLFRGGRGVNLNGRRRRRMNVGNMKALNRAMRRAEGFERAYNRVMRSMGKPTKKLRYKGCGRGRGKK
jgi:hypothetical protein